MNPVARYAVQLDGGGNGLLLKADNLVPTARAPPSSRTHPAPSQPATQSIASSGAAPLPMEWSEALALARTELAQLHLLHGKSAPASVRPALALALALTLTLTITSTLTLTLALALALTLALTLTLALALALTLVLTRWLARCISTASSRLSAPSARVSHAHEARAAHPNRRCSSTAPSSPSASTLS